MQNNNKVNINYNAEYINVNIPHITRQPTDG